MLFIHFRRICQKILCASRILNHFNAMNVDGIRGELNNGETNVGY
jgi:hypothetical protein